VVAGAARYDIYELIRSDGARVQFYTSVGGAAPLLALFNAPAAGIALLTGNPAVVNGNVITVQAIGTLKNQQINQGFENRVLRTLSNADGVTANKILNLFLPIKRMFKLFEYNQHVFRGIKHTVRLYKNLNNKTMFMRTPDALDAQLTMNNISWWIPMLRPSIEYGLKFDKELNSGQKTNLMWNQLKTYISPEFASTIGINGSQWRVTSTGNKPVRVFLVFRHQNQYANLGAQSGSNAMVFQHMNITNIQIRINSLQFPKEEFIADFLVNDNWSRLYMQYLELTGKIYDSDGGGASISYDDFRNIYPLFCFDLSKQDPQIWANVTQAEIEVRYIRSAELPAPNNVPFKIYAIIEFERQMELQGVDNRLRIIL